MRLVMLAIFGVPSAPKRKEQQETRVATGGYLAEQSSRCRARGPGCDGLDTSRRWREDGERLYKYWVGR